MVENNIPNIKLAKSIYDHSIVDYVSFTDAALGAIMQSLREKQLEDKEDKLIGLRIVITSGTCGAFSYNIEYAYKDNNITPDDDVIYLENGIAIFIDPKGSFLLCDMEMDYQDDGIEYGFKFANPNEDEKCKCGTSFYVKG